MFFWGLLSVIWWHKFFELVIVGCFVFIFRQEIFRRIGVALEWVKVVFLWAAAALALGDIEVLLIIAVDELDSGWEGRWKDPLSDRMLVI